MCACVLSHFSRVWIPVTVWAVAHEAPLSMGFSRQEYWSGLPCPPQRDRPDPGIKPVSPAFVGWFFSTWEAPGNICTQHNCSCSQKPHAWEPEHITCTGEMTWLSRDPIISSGRRETSQTAALIPSWQVSTDWVRTTSWGPLRAFVYIWRERETELQIFFILGNSLYFPKIVEPISFIPNAINSMSFLWYSFH